MAAGHSICRYAESDIVDVHSFSQRSSLRVRHADIRLAADFDRRILHGEITLVLRRPPEFDDSLFLDTRDLDIFDIAVSKDGASFHFASFEVHEPDPILGSALQIRIPPGSWHVQIRYATNPRSTALQWLNNDQTSSRAYPYLFTQSQEIHCRSWLPIQDSPSIRLSYTARVVVPPYLRAVMGAELIRSEPSTGTYEFKMGFPVPPYLISLAVGRISFLSTGHRTGVFAEPDLVASAAREFSDTEEMISVTEKLYGAYRWGRFDLLILPPSFPFGGMENPRVPFITPTAIAGDRSLVSLIAHELAHSWSGNLVTNATWADFWVNEGFTTYIQYRIQERLYGRVRAEMESELEELALSEDISTLDPCDQVLHIDLQGRDPDAGSTLVPYVKGSLFLRTIETRFGRKRLDAFLRSYFEEFAFRSITTKMVLDYLQQELFVRSPEIGAKIPIHEWISSPGLPRGAAVTRSAELRAVKGIADHWIKKSVLPRETTCKSWTASQWIFFLSVLPMKVNPSQLRELDRVYKLTASQNAEILSRWFVIAARNSYTDAFSAIEKFLLEVGRRKFLKPLYSQLASNPETKLLAVRVYSRARVRYHPITQKMVDEMLGFDSHQQTM